jgi:hypothetical protein
MSAANVKVILTPVSINLAIPVQQFTYPALSSFESDSNMFDFTIGSNVAANTALAANLKIMMDTSTVYSQRVYVLVGPGNVLVNDDAEGTFGNWVTNQGWGITSSQSNSPTHSFTDSPTGNYANSANNSMTIANALNVDSSQVVSVSFFHKYATEEGYDFGYVEVSNNIDTAWQIVKSYTGTLSAWTLQTVDISPYISSAANIRIRFRLYSDGFQTADGWYVDDIKIHNYRVGLVGINSNTELVNSFSLEQNYPNPFNPVTVIRYSLFENRFTSLKIFDALGKEVATLVNEKQTSGNYNVSFNGINLSSGVYFYKLTAGDFVDVKRMVLIK